MKHWLKRCAIGGMALLLWSLALPASDQMPQSDSQWYIDGQHWLEREVARTPNTRIARNVILFIGDGNGVTTVTATRILDGQRKGMQGEENVLSYENMPYTALIKTYNIDAQTPDSAGTASAMLTGVKTRLGVLGVDAGLDRDDCERVSRHSVATFAELARRVGMAVGVVSTASLTHATPAAVYAHSASRSWQSDGDMPIDCQRQKDIAVQMMDAQLDVALGGGRGKFLSYDHTDDEGIPGERHDGRNLITEFKARSGRYLWNRKGLLELQPGLEPVMGLFDESHMDYEHRRDPSQQPSLVEMTHVAIERLAKFEGGYFLLVEGARIDHGHHAGRAFRALNEAIVFANAVAEAMWMTRDTDTLILVTADHAHSFGMHGYARRGSPMLGLCELPDGSKCLDLDGKPYTTLGYLNGPGSVFGSGWEFTRRRHLTDKDVADHDHDQQALVPMKKETHSGVDVALYAQGPWAHLVRGVLEQNVIFHIMYHAANLKKRSFSPEQ